MPHPDPRVPPPRIPKSGTMELARLPPRTLESYIPLLTQLSKFAIYLWALGSVRNAVKITQKPTSVAPRIWRHNTPASS